MQVRFDLIVILRFCFFADDSSKDVKEAFEEEEGSKL